MRQQQRVAPFGALWIATGLVTAVAVPAAEPAPVAVHAASPGELVYQQSCAVCHDHPKDRIPAREQIATRSPEQIVIALTTGVMRPQALGLNLNERKAVATFLTGREPSEIVAAAPEQNRCRRNGPLAAGAPQWNGWGNDLVNSRYQPAPGLTPAQLPRLKLKWAFGYPGTSVYGQPTVVGGRVFVGTVTGRVYSLDAKTGCVHWTFDAESPTRPAISIADVPGVAGPVAFVGDDGANVYALDATRGTLLWKQRLDTHASARISGAPMYHDGRLYVPVSSLEELAALAPNYECCSFRGSVAALDAASGRVLWQRYTIEDAPVPWQRVKDRARMRGPAGGAVWSAPTLDPARGLIYFGTGNSYTDLPAPRTNSVMALSMATGELRWVNQVLPGDNYIVGCESPDPAQRPPACPEVIGPDVDFGTSPILRTLRDGSQVLMTGAKSGLVHALDPQTGRSLWTSRVGTGGPIGGIEWGGAADEHAMYVAVSDITDTSAKGPGGLSAISLEDGRQLWHTPAPAPVCSWGTRQCTAAQSQAVTAIPGAVFAGSHDGHLRAYSTQDGRVLWDTDTGVAFRTVNKVPGAGGSLDHGGATVAGGRVFVNSGYGRINGQPGNVLLVYGID